MSTRISARATLPSTSVASPSAAMDAEAIEPIRWAIICAVMLSVAIVAGTAYFLSNSHTRVLAENERELSRTSLILAKQIEAIFSAVETVQKGVLEHIADIGSLDGESLERELSRHE